MAPGPLVDYKYTTATGAMVAQRPPCPAFDLGLQVVRSAVVSGAAYTIKSRAAADICCVLCVRVRSETSLKGFIEFSKAVFNRDSISTTVVCEGVKVPLSTVQQSPSG